jgi:hypothetical protein
MILMHEGTAVATANMNHDGGGWMRPALPWRSSISVLNKDPRIKRAHSGVSLGKIHFGFALSPSSTRSLT